MDNTYATVWKSVLGELEVVLSQANYGTWLKGTRLDSIKNGVAVVFVPNIFNRDWIARKYHEQILAALQNADSSVKELTYTTRSKQGSQKPGSTQTIEPKSSSSPIASELRSIKRSSFQRPLQRYSFDNFIVGASNRLAFSAAQLVVERPGDAYNPLFIYGPAGVGKTHLMSAISTEIIKRDPSTQTLYVTSEEFINSFVGAIRKGEKFTNKYRSVDVLLVDDMQFIASAEKTKEEFFHTFNALHQRGKQIVLCSDRPPKEIPTLEDRLRSRFEWGMVADIQPPDYETRVAILLNKAQAQKINLSPDVAEFIAQIVERNIRELEGALIKLGAYSLAHNRPVDLELAKQLLGEHTNNQPKKIKPKVVLELCADYFDISFKDIVSTKRDKDVVVPRQVAMYIMRSKLGMSFPKIASSLGKKDHTTIMHGVKKIQAALTQDTQLGGDINKLAEEMAKK
ncbi:chromosomal replication initiator protein DnaA [Candidatus Saccharibacteria bacterium]|nr:chromosomal replication initiator protein DnaA [Candidatus Saccharibacteria bacterium]